MKSKIHAFPIILTTIVVAFIAIVGFSRMKNQFQNYKSEKITIGKSEFTAYIADTPQLQEQGLSGTQKIPENSGMLFIFPKLERYSFWMKDMHYPLDMIWIKSTDGTFVVADITENATPESYPLTFSPITAVSLVFEVDSGVVKKQNIHIGDEVKIIR